MANPNPAFADEIFTFAVAQTPFETPSPSGTTLNLFCTALPLWHEDWRPVQEAEFPNNGLVWWKLRPGMREWATPGRLLSGRVEPAPRYAPDDPNKQLYQVVTNDIEALSPDEGIEVLRPDPRSTHDARDLLNRAGVLTVDHAPTPEVLVRVGEWIYGPFRTRATPQPRGRWSVSLDPVSGSAVERMEASRLEPALLRLNDVAISLDSQPPTRGNNLILCRYEVIDAGTLAEYRRHAERVVVTRDQDVLARLAHRFRDAGERMQFAELLNRITQSSEDGDAGEVDERELIAALQRQVPQQSSATLDLARSLLDTGLLDSRIAEAVNDAVRERVRTRAAELDEEARSHIATLQNELQLLEGRHAQLDAELRTRLREAEEMTQQRVAEAWARHEERVAEEEARLEQEIAVYRGWQPPAFVTAARQATPIDERTFYDRFVDHVETSGFTFRDIDLQMFHVAFKSAPALCVCGPAGSGRSSLPFLYAEALAAADMRTSGPQEPQRFLRVPVRASWVDAADLLGHLNPLSNAFVPAANGCYTQLLAATEEYRMHRAGSGVYPILLDDADPASARAWLNEMVAATRTEPPHGELHVFSQHAIDPQSPFRRWHTIDMSPAVRWMLAMSDVSEYVTTMPVIHLAVADEIAPGGASRGAPDGPPVRVFDLDGWRRTGVLGTSHAAALEALDAVLRRAAVPIDPASIRLLRRLVAGANAIMSLDAAFDYGVAHTVLRRTPLDSQLIGELLDVVEDLKLRLPETARVLEERRAIAQRHGI